MLTVATPAPDRALLTAAELRGAVGVSDTASDGPLQILGDRVAAAIAHHCGVASDGLNPPTLRRETLTETFRLSAGIKRLILSRRPVSAVVSVVEIGTTLDSVDYELYAGPGLLLRLKDDCPVQWQIGKVVVTYEAGFLKVPDDLKLAAAKLARHYWSEATRDPLVRSEEIPDVLTTTYWVGGIGDGALPPDICDLLSPYKNHRV